MRTPIALGMLVLFAPKVSVAQERALTLSQATEIALRANPDVQEARAAVDAARGNRLVAGSLAFPVLGIEFAEVEGVEAASFGETRVGVSQAFPFPGKRPLRRTVADATVGIAEARLHVIEVLTRRAVAEAFFRVQRLEAGRRTLLESAALASDLVEVVRGRYRLDRASYGDLLSFLIEHARVQEEILALENELRAARTDLALLLGFPSTETLEPMGPFEYRPLEGSLRAWLARRRAESGALGIARLEVERARSDLRLARLTTYPDFEVGLFYQRLNESRPESFLAAELSIDLPVWRDRPQGREMTAVAELRAAQIRSAATERRLEADVRDAFAGAATNENRVELFRDRLLEDTEAALENAIDVYRNGRLDAVALLDAYRTSKEVRIDYLETLEGYLRALVRLQTAGEFDALETAQSRPAAEEEVSP